MAKRRIAVVGCGSIGRRHARVLSARQELAVELCESHPDHLQRALREVGEVPTHASFESLLATRPELVVIATPHRLHAEMSIRSLQAGCHVLCEKPMSDSLAQARRMLRGRGGQPPGLQRGIYLPLPSGDAVPEGAHPGGSLRDASSPCTSTWGHTSP